MDSFGDIKKEYIKVFLKYCLIVRYLFLCHPVGGECMKFRGLGGVECMKDEPTSPIEFSS